MVYAKFGTNKTIVNVENYNLIFPNDGLFVAFENLTIKENEYSFQIKNAQTNEVSTYTTYYPNFKYNWVDDENTFSCYSGKWKKQQKFKYRDSSDDLAIFEPLIYIVLTD